MVVRLFVFGYISRAELGAMAAGFSEALADPP